MIYLVGGNISNAKRKVYIMPSLRKQNKSADTGRYRVKKLPAVLSKVP